MNTKTALALALITLSLTGPARAQERRDRTPDATAAKPPAPLRNRANPGTVVAAEIAFARLAQEKGQWTAFRATAAPTAEMFTPRRVRVADWLKGKPDPARSVTWQPHAVWSSCDGTIAVTHGAWQDGDKAGYFTTVWEQQKNRRYKWVLDHGDALPFPLDRPEMIQAKVATCEGRPGLPLTAPAVGEDMKTGASRDQSLLYASTVRPDGSRSISVRVWNGAAHDTVLEETVAAEGQ